MSCELPPRPDDQDEPVGDSWENRLAALINQMEKNWDLGDNAANDDLVVQIREHLCRQWAAAHNNAAQW